MDNDPVANEYFPRLREEFAELQLVLLDGDEVLSHANTIPVAWDGTPDPRGVDWALATTSSKARTCRSGSTARLDEGSTWSPTSA